MKLRLLVVPALLALTACGDEDPIVVADTGTTDTGAADTGATDTGATDTGTTDVGGDTGVTDVSTDTVEEDAESDVPEGVTLESIQTNIFEDSCGGGFCHLGGQDAGGINLDLSDGLLDALLAPSSISGLNLIEPGDPTLSYLYLKSSGEFGAVGGTGSQMPLGAPPLTDEQLQMLADWITDL